MAEPGRKAGAKTSLLKSRLDKIKVRRQEGGSQTFPPVAVRRKIATSKTFVEAELRSMSAPGTQTLDSSLLLPELRHRNESPPVTPLVETLANLTLEAPKAEISSTVQGTPEVLAETATDPVKPDNDDEEKSVHEEDGDAIDVAVEAKDGALGLKGFQRAARLALQAAREAELDMMDKTELCRDMTGAHASPQHRQCIASFELLCVPHAWQESVT